MPENLARSEAHLNAINSQTLRSVLLVTKGATFDEAVAKSERSLGTVSQLKSTGVVKKFTGIAEIIVSDSTQKARIARWNTFWTRERKDAALKGLEEAGANVGFSNTAFVKFHQLLDKSFSPLTKETSGFLKKTYFSDLVSETDTSCTIISNVKVQLEDKPAVFAAFAGLPDIGIVDRQYMTTQLVAIVNRDFTWIAGVSSIIVFLALLLSYGRIELALITFVPMFISWLWILGIMAIFGIQFNIVNIIISTFIFGLGDDYSIFVSDGLLTEYKTGRKVLGINKSAVFLSALSTVIGLGVLILAKHPALKSIALISIIGMVCVVLTSYTLIPFFFRFFIGDRAEKGQIPYTAKSFLVTIFTFSYFAVGCLLLNLIAIVLFGFRKTTTGKPNALLCRLLHCTSNSLIFGTFTVKKKIQNPYKENFSKPAIIIANHQSFLDILLTVMLHPKVILVTNDWVWNSPVFGFAIRKAGYFPASKGIEHHLEELRAKVDAGFSIVIFPEGTRSVDGTIHRFHKGAFYLAEQLQVDIVPVLLHGTGDCVKKGDSFIVNDGTITLKIGQRISPNEPSFEAAYSERTKSICQFFRIEYEKLRLECETPSYFHQRVQANFLYKGPTLEWYVRVKLLMEKNYIDFHNLTPLKGQITDIGCGYGYMDYMLSNLSKERVITAIDHDEEKTEIAQHGFGRTDKLNFYCQNILEFPLHPSDAFILSDVLHYLSEADQIQLLQNCADHLLDGGRIIIRDGDSDLSGRHKNTEMTEFISTNIGFNKTMPDKKLHFISGSWLSNQASRLSLTYKRIDSAKRTSNVFYILEK
jgi:1-acyl-sn-glycerol-3-phosphate acyltransferase